MPTKKDRLYQKSRSMFANRVKELAIFRDFILNDNDYEMLHFYGIGGVGKTAMLEAFGITCEEFKIPWVRANVGDQELPAQLVRFIYEQLSRNNQIKFSQLPLQFSKYENLDTQIRETENIPSDILNILMTGMSNLKGSTAGGEQGTERAINFLINFLGIADSNFYLNPTSQFTEALIQDLNEIQNNQKVCLMFDRYERISIYLDDWIRENLFPKLEHNILLVTAGRQPLSEKWQEWLPIIRLHELEPLEEKATGELVRLRGIKNENAINEIVEFAGGLPLAASLATDLLKEGGVNKFEFHGISGHETIIELLVQKLTDEAPAEIRGWIEQCAIIRWFNEDTLEQFIGIPSELASSTYERLRQLSFTQPHTNGLAFHDLVREFIAGSISKRSKRRFKELHKKAFKYYEQLIANGQRREDQQIWLVESVYHLLRADQTDGINRLRELFDNATDFSQSEFSDALLGITKGLEIEDKNKLWIIYFEGVLWQQKNIDNLKSAKLLDDLFQKSDIENFSELKARSAAYLSVVLWYIAEFKSALKYAQIGFDLSNNLKLPKSRNRSLEVLGLTYDRLGLFQEGINSQLDLLELTKQSSDRMGEAWTLNNLGYFSWHSGKWSDAEKYLLKCRSAMLELQSPYNVVYPLGHLGLLYTAVGRLEESDKLLAESLDVCREEKNLEMESKILQNLADLRLIQHKDQDALEHINRAFEVNKKLIHPYFDCDCFRRLGNIYMNMGKLEEACVALNYGFELAGKLEAGYLKQRLLSSFLKLEIKGWLGDLPSETKEIIEVCNRFGYYQIISDVYFLQGTKPDNKNWMMDLFNSLLYGMLYNRYVLYSKLDDIFRLDFQWTEQNGVSKKLELLEFIRTSWKTETYNDVPIVNLEKMARQNDLSLMPLPHTVEEQLQLSLSYEVKSKT